MKRTSRRAWGARAIATALVVFAICVGVRHRQDDTPTRDVSSTREPLATRTSSRSEKAPNASVAERAVESAPSPEPSAADAPADVEFWGRVVADENGEPLAGAEIGRLAYPDDGFRSLITTDSDGYFRWPVEPEPWFELRATGFARTSRRADLESACRERAREIRLKHGATLEVHVEFGDAPPANVSASVFVLDSDLDEMPGGWQAPLEGTRATLRDLPPRVELMVGIDQDHVASLWDNPDRILLEPGEVRALDVDLRTGSRLAVTLRDAEGVPVPKRLLWLGRASELAFGTPASTYLAPQCEFGPHYKAQLTDENGRAVFRMVEPGDWYVGPSEDEDDIAPVGTFVKVLPGVADSSIDIAAQRGLFLRGRLLTPFETAIRQVSVKAIHEAMGGVVYCEDVRKDGTFVLGPVAGGQHLVEVLSYGPFAAPDPVRALPNGDEITIQLFAGCEIRGRVLDGATGQPIAANLVYSQSADEGERCCTGDGDFHVGALRPGTYSIAAAAHDAHAAGLVRDIRVDAGQTIDDVRIVLQPAARLVVRYRGAADNAKLVIWSEGVVVESSWLLRDSELECGVPAGRVEARLTIGAQERLRRAIDAQAGETTEVLLEID
ncbi:MAG: carboxypeptidase regulatory-like domain-containing protein [Planctomycetes bacterium]|nr:carboxypeptidase regulatory-like domain-containing protein [Planctomycetota bacterium]MBI3843906.1 carboxypeptidase regulatory-like domain-containing protein [Planctomycetota bacterium]